MADPDDKLIGSRRGEGTLWPPYILFQGEVGVDYPPKTMQLTNQIPSL